MVNTRHFHEIGVHKISVCFDGVSWSGVEGCLRLACASAFAYFVRGLALKCVARVETTIRFSAPRRTRSSLDTYWFQRPRSPSLSLQVYFFFENKSIASIFHHLTLPMNSFVLWNDDIGGRGASCKKIFGNSVNPLNFNNSRCCRVRPFILIWSEKLHCALNKFEPKPPHELQNHPKCADKNLFRENFSMFQLS